FVGILIDFGLIPVTAQMMSEPSFDKIKLFKNLFTYRLITAIIFLGIAPLIALFFPYPIEVKIAISFTTISFLGVAINQVLVGLYQTKLKMYVQAIGENIGRIVLVVGLCLVIFYNQGFVPVMIVVTLSSIAFTLFLLIKARNETPLGFAFDKEIWKAITVKMWPIAISIIFNVVYLKGDIILLSFFRSQTEVGIYGAAYRVIDVLSSTAMLLIGIMLPLLTFHWSRKNKGEFKKYFQLSFDAMMALAIPMSAGVIVLAKPIMTIIAGEKFDASVLPLQILAIAIFGVYLGAVFGHTAVAINRQKQTMWIYISTAIITLTGYLIFIPRYGMYGAAWMTVFSEIYVGIMLFFTIRHYSKERLQLHTLAKIIFSSLVMTASLYLLSSLNVILLVALGVLIYSTMLLALGGISKATIKDILSLEK
ncbi:polysaccharide biosynthesis C-terminal domain-containing protein, partial [Patescibacteria group bacterium]|nr:polysaccharide biosynthesis C-terminal domain-containing protein [Patescibacteria group bacterium]